MIAAAGLTPAWQKILEFPRVAPSEVNRASGVWSCASGKVLNVARACHALGANTQCVTLIGGPAAAAIRSDADQQGLHAHWIATKAATRTCITLLESESGRTTELVENAGPVTPDELREFQATCRELIRATDVVVLSGSLPPGAPATIYATLLEGYAGEVVIDARGPELRAALPSRPLLVKPNREELEKTLERPLPDAAALQAAMRELNDRGAQWVLVTAGPGIAWLSSAKEMLEFHPLPVPQVRNPIGSGDCVAAGFAVAIDRGWNVPDAVEYGLAAASVNVGRLFPADVDRAAVDAIFENRSTRRQ